MASSLACTMSSGTADRSGAATQIADAWPPRAAASTARATSLAFSGGASAEMGTTVTSPDRNAYAPAGAGSSVAMMRAPAAASACASPARASTGRNGTAATASATPDGSSAGAPVVMTSSPRRSRRVAQLPGCGSGPPHTVASTGTLIPADSSSSLRIGATVSAVRMALCPEPFSPGETGTFTRSRRPTGGTA